ncbi:GTPase Era [Corynebacterium kalinowskii]|uniref:GTPase Era n=1 Tax=Corynebacterium kalinowskii TaxID=2675216 RepID=A0A6B8W6R0_9CORY|nr:GTPase [Corynebacterium kalinowskii]QGU02878.1 GTPase Era [Corynebacterium kalinowskii]
MFKSKPTLTQRLEALERATELAEGIYTPEELERLDKVIASAAERRALSAEHTVVGFFGATGSGKTSLFNAVVGEDLGKTAARRPTTSSPLAAVWHPEGSEELLDWLEVEDRRNRPGDFAKNAGPLILLDLPDFDSVEPIHREIATRLAGQVDVLVWVTDPEKYADTIIHDHFIRPHAEHSAVTLAVLNKSDKLRPEDLGPVKNSLEQLLVEDGLKKIKVIATSAKTGAGVDDIRAAIAKVASDHKAQSARLEADIAAATGPLLGSEKLSKVPDSAKKNLDNALAEAAGADHISRATAAAYRKRLGQATGWLLTSWMLRLRPDPLRRLGLREDADEVGVHRTSMPALDASRRAVANRGVRDYAAVLEAGLPARWADALHDETEAVVEKLPEQLDRAAAGTRLPAQPSKAWGLFTFIQWLALLAALVGVIWYLLVAFLPGALVPLLGEDLTPDVEGWPIPTLLILGGVLLGILLGLLTAVFGGFISSGVRSRTRRALRREVAEMSQAEITAPLLDVRGRYLEFREQLQSATGR